MQRCPKCGWTGEAEACPACAAGPTRQVRALPARRRAWVLGALLLGVLALALVGFPAWRRGANHQRCRREVCPGGSVKAYVDHGKARFYEARDQLAARGCLESCRVRPFPINTMGDQRWMAEVEAEEAARVPLEGATPAPGPAPGSDVGADPASATPRPPG